MTAKRKLATFGVIVIILLVTVGAVALLIATKRQPKKRVPISKGILVDTLLARAAPASMLVRGFGTAEAKTDWMLVAQVTGRIEFLAPHLRVGATVEEGDLLLRIDPRSFAFSVEQTQAAVANAKAQLHRHGQTQKNDRADLALAEQDVELAKRARDRSQALLESRSGSEEKHDLSERAWLSARQRVQTIQNRLDLWTDEETSLEAAREQAEAQWGEAKRYLEYSSVTAPFAGRVAERLVEAGQFVSPGTPLARIYDPEVIEIEVRVPLDDFSWIESSAEHLSRLETQPKVALRPASEGGEFIWHGAVTRTDGRIDEATRTAGLIVEVNETQAEGTLNGSARQLLPGMFLDVRIEGRTVEGVIAIPRGAVDQNDRVFIALDGHLAIRSTHVLRTMDGMAWTQGGVETGDLIIVSPLATPVEGIKVRLATPGSAKPDSPSDSTN
jgi:RND family efflux transporter MFP subunit